MSKTSIKKIIRYFDKLVTEQMNCLNEAIKLYHKLLVAYANKYVTAIEAKQNDEIDASLCKECVRAEEEIHSKANMLSFTMDLELALLETYIQDLIGRNHDNIKAVKVGFESLETVYVAINTKDNFRIGLLVKIDPSYRIKTIHGYIEPDGSESIGVTTELYNIDKPIIKDNWWSKDKKKIS